MTPKDIHSIIFNPNWTALQLHSFLSGAAASHTQKIKYEIIYICLPALYNDDLVDTLKSKRSDSNLESLLKPALTKSQMLQAGQNCNNYRSTTNRALLLLGKSISISRDGFIQCTVPTHYKDASNSIREKLKAAYNLGRILANENHLEIFLKLGIRI